MRHNTIATTTLALHTNQTIECRARMELSEIALNPST